MVRAGRRFTEQWHAQPERVRALGASHPAVLHGRTIFRKSVVSPKDSPRLLVSGAHNRKLGRRVLKGPWKRAFIYQLSLEERATCPMSCDHWRDCYGNAMPFARRHGHGPDLEWRLWLELGQLQQKHARHGFVVRLHVLGDFYNREYVHFWADALDAFSSLRVFGYTAWQPSTVIGQEVLRLRKDYPGRWFVRFSGLETAVLDYVPVEAKVPQGLVCPAQTERTDCCATCALCWSPAMSEVVIAFIRHGKNARGHGGAQYGLPLQAQGASNVE